GRIHVRRGAGKRLLLAGEVDEVWCRKGRALEPGPRHVRVQRDETIRLREAEGPKEHRVDDAEGGGVDADPETERQHDNGAEAWIASQRPDRMAKIVEKRRHGRFYGKHCEGVCSKCRSSLQPIA